MIDTVKIRELLARFKELPDFPQPGPIGDAEIDALEKRMAIRVPDDLREWLKFQNGAIVGTVLVYGVHPSNSPLSLESVFEVFPLWRLRKWIPISDDGCGNYYVIPTEGEFGAGFPVVFVEAVIDDSVPRYILASDLGHFLIPLIESELALRAEVISLAFDQDHWPFNEQATVHADPAILDFHGVSLPWNCD